MGFRCGIVGLPNVGKSTLYNALTAAAVAADNYPFCTIDPNVGVVPVPDPRLAEVARLAGSARAVPATMEFVDIAGLVAGASRGEGLGNRFLAHIREMQAMAHVVRCFEEPNVAHVTGTVSPRADIEVVNTELLLADLETLGRAREKAASAAKSGEAAARARHALLERIEAHLGEGRPARELAIGAEEAPIVDELQLLTRKPVIYIANVSEEGFEDNAHLDEVRGLARAEGAAVVPVCAAIEAELISLEPTDRDAFLADLGLEEPGLNRVIRAGYALLSLHTFLTANAKEARAWTIPVGATALEAAGKIHTDFARGFIRAEVASFEDFVHYRGEQGAKEAGRMRAEGRDYVVRDGDVIRFRFNV